MGYRILIVGILSAFLALAPACSDPDTSSNFDNFTLPDAGDEDTDDLDADDRDTDTGDVDADTDVDDDADVDDLPVTRSCPEDVEDSCAADILGCPGDMSTQVACVSFGEPGSPGYRLEAQFSNQAVVHYRRIELEGEIREFRTAYDANGERCYNLSAEEEGDQPQSWLLSDPQFGSFGLDFVGDNVHIDCAGAFDDEVCSLSRINSTFSIPLQRPEGCEPFTPDDTCSFDTDCGDSEGCCQAQGTNFRQCMSLEYCISQRDPIDCETNADCEAGETCMRCNRDDDGGQPQRECIPDEIAEDEDNALGCVNDGCIPGTQECADDRTCCRSAGLYQCLPPFECDEGPDPNPVCDPTSTQPCPSASQDCCFSDLSNEFRCLFDAPFCPTNVCFSDVDCASDQECCGHDPDTGTAGSCVSSCQPPDLSCDDSSDCFGEGYCCKLPGLDSGLCEPSELACEPPYCDNDGDCLEGSICCDEAPLTAAVCVRESDGCPPS